MPRVVMRYNNPSLKVAATEAGLTAGTAFECQVTQALVEAQPVYQTIPATGCAGEAQSPGTTGYQLNLAWLQDWTAGAASLSKYAYDHDGEEGWFELTPDKNVTTTKITGHVFIAAGDFGGTFGDGSVAIADAIWPCIDKPVVVAPAAMAAAADVESDEADEVLAPA